LVALAGMMFMMSQQSFAWASCECENKVPLNDVLVITAVTAITAFTNGHRCALRHHHCPVSQPVRPGQRPGISDAGLSSPESRRLLVRRRAEHLARVLHLGLWVPDLSLRLRKPLKRARVHQN